MTYIEQDLLDRGFKDRSWSEDGNEFTEHVLGNIHLRIEISGLNLIELFMEENLVEVNIDTLSELDTVIKVFGLNNK